MSQLLQSIDFGNEAGDDLVDAEQVKDFFVEQTDFKQFLDPKQRIMLATAKKGVGKSALLRWIETEVVRKDPNALVISVKGSDLVRSSFKLSGEPKLPNEFIRDWMIRMCALVNRRIGAEIKIALTDDSISLVENAEIDGFKSLNIVSALARRMTQLLPKTNNKQLPIANELELLKRMEDRSVWLLVDDLDATYQRTDQENLELSTFFSACRYLCSQTFGINVRITMRTDVWPLIRRYDESLDKFEQYVQDITWSQADFRTLLSKRIETQMSILAVTQTAPPSYAKKEEIEEHTINKVFEKRMPWGDTDQRTYKVIYTVSYHRPRWAIQLCKLAQKAAINSKASLIAKEHIDEVWGNYGQKRIADLIAEHKHQCKEIEEILSGFRGAERKMTRTTLLVWIKNRVTNHMTPIIEGRPIKESLEIAHFLFRIGFIVARSEVSSQKNYEHYFFADMPDFLSSRTNSDFGVVWEIHPCYREALDIKKLNEFTKQRRNNRN